MTTMAEGDRAPRWFVRYLTTVFLVVVIAGIGYYLYLELTQSERIEADMRRSSCDYARTAAAVQIDSMKAQDLGAWARVVCAGVRGAVK